MEGPKTIEELKQWYVDKNLPPENITRFFIGKNHRGAKAFGIYFDEATEDYIVYKNKGDGERVVRYQGKDQAYAVNELYKKLKDEIYNQKMNNPQNYDGDGLGSNYQKRINNNYGGKQIKLISPAMFIFVFLLLILAIIIIFLLKMPRRGYYNYNDSYYYYQNGSWYQYSDYGGWRNSVVPETLKTDYKDYYSSYDYYSYYGIDNFEYSGYYIEPSSSSSSSSWDDDDYDYDYDWDSGSDWDSDFTDWDSDW